MTEKSDFNFIEERREPSGTTGELELLKREIERLTVACETIYQENQAMIDCHKPNLDKIAALTDRLESQAAYIKELEEALKSLIPIVANQRNEIIVLTARAEQAEAREKAAIAFITRDRYCEDCVDSESPDDSDACASCWTRDKKPNFRYRGLPQDGEGLK